MVNIYNYCKNLGWFFDVALITLLSDNRLFFCAYVCDIYYTICRDFFISYAQIFEVFGCYNLQNLIHEVVDDKSSNFRI